MSYLWPEQKRGKWFGKFLAGTVLEKCNGGRLFDVILDDFDDAINNFINRTNIIQHLLASLTVDPRQILQGDPPQKPLVYYENMKMLIWDDLDDVRGHVGLGLFSKFWLVYKTCYFIENQQDSYCIDRTLDVLNG
ncbi:uncharacterized protein LOC135384300 [Ornithodoros turicata]|uniref:uncharacterized protein LOC135384300 n=1 Tax=Ornithodoros turicata TaxID=34597 RepID=UPI003138DB25